MVLNFASVGVSIYGFDYIYFNSKASLADYDVIVFEKNLLFIHSGDFATFMDGDRYLTAKKTKELLEYSEHWREELRKSFENGKVIFINLTENSEFLINNKGIIINKNYDVSNYNFYKNCLPFDIEYNNVSGKFIINSTNGKKLTLIDEIKNNLSSYMYFKCTFDIKNNNFIKIFENRVKETIGAYKASHTGGLFILFPFINFNSDTFFNADYDGTIYFTKLAQQIGLNFKQILSDLYRYIKTEKEPLPKWISENQQYLFVEEEKNNKKIRENENDILVLKQENELFAKKNEEFELLKYLIVGTGKQLEDAVKQALKILGLESRRYENSSETLEIDCLIKYENKIFVGEVEGKIKDIDNSKINQVISHIKDYYKCEMENIGEQPKGILFGNPQKNEELEKRTSKGFTDKCIKISESNDISLVLTKDLFFVVKYVKDTNDKKYAKQCIKSILETKNNIVKFPELPVLNNNGE